MSAAAAVSIRRSGPAGCHPRPFPAAGPDSLAGMYVIRERFFAFGDDFDVLDEHGNKVLHVDGKVFSVRDKVVIEDLNGDEVASVHRQLVALRQTYEIRIGGEKAAEVRKKLFTPFRDKFTIDVPGPDDLEMKGDLLDHEYVFALGWGRLRCLDKGFCPGRNGGSN